MNPIWLIVLYASNLFILDWAKPTTLPITKDSKELNNNKFLKRSPLIIWSILELSGIEDPINKSNKKINILILGIIVSHIVTMVGLSSYTSGAQLCRGAAAILNKNPMMIKIIPKLNPWVIVLLVLTFLF